MNFIKIFIKAKDISSKSVGLELNKTHRKNLNNANIQCVEQLSELYDDKFDLIILNHVFEHLNDPINTLIELQKYLKDNGVIVIEVPHARDLLLETFNLESFKNFTFWSEHLILHTRKSLSSFVKNSGLKVNRIDGHQRHPLSNHFGWLLNKRPSGQDTYKELNNDIFSKQYEYFLDIIDQTDTLIGYFCLN